MVVGDTCIVSSAAVPLPHLPNHYQSVPILTNNTHLAMNAAMVDQIRQQLIAVVEKDDELMANDLINQLENAALSKEILEVTRIGRYVNEVRKQTVERWPEFSKRCRAIIKQWQKLAEYNRPGSSCGGSSNGGTPQLISPALRNKGLTPKTPGKQQSQQQYQRVTSATLPPPRDNFTGSPSQFKTTTTSTAALVNGIEQRSAIGSYAPLPPGSKISPPNNANLQKAIKHVHKSSSMGAALSTLAEEDVAQTNQSMVNGFSIVEAGKPPAEYSSSAATTSTTAVSKQPPLMLKLKRTTSAVQRLTRPSATATADPTANGISPPATATLALPTSSTESSVQAARKNVQSTAELMAQLSEQLPQHIGQILDIGAVTTTTANLLREQQQILAAESDQQSSSTQLIPPLSVIDLLSKTDGKTTTIEAPEAETMQIIEMATERSSIIEMGGTTMESSTNFVELKTKRKRGRPKKMEKTEKAAASADGEGTSPSSRGTVEKFNWFKKFRHESTNDDEPMVAVEDPSASLRQISAERERSFVLPLNNNQRNLLLMPYLDIGRPDWLVHDLPAEHGRDRLFPDQF